MNLTFYNTGFRPEYNGVYEEIETYLATLTPTYSTEYKFIDPALNVVIKIDASSHQFDTRNIGNFVRATDGTNIWYYFVMNCQWRGKETLLLELGLDTLNTFWKELKFSKESHITRRYKDRFIDDRQGRGIPVVDAFPEEINTPPQIRTAKQVVGDAAKWYLMYKTDYTQQPDQLGENPVSCFCCCEVLQPIVTQNVGEVTWTAKSMGINRWYCIYGEDCKGTTVRIGTNTLTVNPQGRESYIYFYKDNDNIKLVYVEFPVNPNYGSVQIKEFSNASLVFVSCSDIFMQMGNPPTKPVDATTAGKVLAYFNSNIRVWIGAGGQYSEITDFATWYTGNKTDPTLVKIVELPYAPFQVQTDTEGRLVKPNGWDFENNLLKLTNPNVKFENIITTKTVEIPALDIDQFTPEHAPLGAAYEPKLYNSTFSSFKFVYDTNSYSFEPEQNPDPLNRANSAKITFYASSNLENGLAFKFDTKLNQNQDFGEFLLSNRSNSLPYYTNDYLNYLRFGKSVDERQMGMNIAGAGLRGVGATISTAASIGAGLAIAGSAAAAPLAIAGAVIGAATTAISISQTVVSSLDDINSKIDRYTHQASNVSGSSDVSIFDIYAQNKLLYVTYTPRDEFKNSIYNFFRYYGYACDEYGDIKQMYSRVYSDYFVVNPVFEDALLWNPYKEDIGARLKLGIRVYHYKNGYDFQLTHENWEKAIYDDWSN